MPANQSAQSVVVIPARFASTRLPQKMLLRDTGATLVEHTYRAAARATRPRRIIVATDHHAIAADVRRFGGDVVMTGADCASGTDRVAEVARQLPGVDIVVNVQGDEPEIDPRVIDQVIELLETDPTAAMATIAAPLVDHRLVHDPACVKVVCDDQGSALYFSRSPIPYYRDRAPEEGYYLQHVGIYAYRREFLLRLASAPPSSLELAERLEQLRVLQLGQKIRVGLAAQAAAGIDTPADYDAFVARFRAAG